MRLSVVDLSEIKDSHSVASEKFAIEEVIDSNCAVRRGVPARRVQHQRVIKYIGPAIVAIFDHEGGGDA